MDGLKHAVNWALGPERFFVGSIVGLALVLYGYRTVTKPVVAGLLGALFVAFFAFALTDPHFRGHDMAGKADNAPILAILFLVPFFLWLALRQAALNDERMGKGLPPREKEDAKEKILVFPDLVYTEFISTILLGFLLVVWSVFLKAPLEQPSNPSNTPNPSKAPWYFLGLQEMLVYYDPWNAGVVMPGTIIGGLMAIPFIDRNPKGNGYYTLKERPFAIGMFLFGFIVLWDLMVVQGTFLRGPNWNFFGLFEPWDIHKVYPLTNVNLSEYFWVKWLPLLGVRVGMPDPWLVRELPGILLALFYLGVCPLLLAKTLLRRFFKELGFFRFMVLANLFLLMMSLPIKMVLRWTINLKYFVYLPEFFFNI